MFPKVTIINKFPAPVGLNIVIDHKDQIIGSVYEGFTVRPYVNRAVCNKGDDPCSKFRSSGTATVSSYFCVESHPFVAHLMDSNFLFSHAYGEVHEADVQEIPFKCSPWPPYTSSSQPKELVTWVYPTAISVYVDFKRRYENALLGEGHNHLLGPIFDDLEDLSCIYALVGVGVAICDLF